MDVQAYDGAWPLPPTLAGCGVLPVPPQSRRSPCLGRRVPLSAPLARHVQILYRRCRRLDLQRHAEPIKRFYGREVLGEDL